MPIWKRNIFISAIKFRSINENRTPEQIIAEYTKLTENEKQEILANI